LGAQQVLANLPALGFRQSLQLIPYRFAAGFGAKEDQGDLL
jgi:hypothetical protein